MKLTINEDTLILNEDNINHEYSLYSTEAFKIISEIWIKQHWNSSLYKSFSWFGFPIWQLPEDLLRLQEAILNIRPDVIIETGLNLGGSSIFFASLCKLMGKGRVLSIDINVLPSIKEKISNTQFADIITLIEGDSVSTNVVNQVNLNLKPEDSVFIFLDSNHTKEHVLDELNIYSKLVSKGSYIVACDGIMKILSNTPNGLREWYWNNPLSAIDEFLKNNNEFSIKKPQIMYETNSSIDDLTFWPNAWLLRN